MKAWELIDAAGCRGLTRGGAMVSEKHCNFLINTGAATAADIEGLGEEVRRRVLAATGVTLEWEIRRIGIPGRQAGDRACGCQDRHDPRRGPVRRHLRRTRGQPVHRHAGDRRAAGGRFRRRSGRCRP